MNRHFDPDDWKPCPNCHSGFEYEAMHTTEGGIVDYGVKMSAHLPKVFKTKCPDCNGTGWIFNGFETDMSLEEIRAYYASLPKPDIRHIPERQGSASLPYEVTINNHVLRGKDEMTLLEQAVAVWIKEGGQLNLGEGFYRREKGKILTAEEYDLETYELIENSPAQVTTPHAGRKGSTHDKRAYTERIA